MEVRIVSLSAWGTQVLLDLDLDHWIAGCSHDALIPPEAKKEVAVITKPFDARIKRKDDLTLTEMLLSPWEVDMSLLRQLKPSHIITEGMVHISGLSQEEAGEILERDGLPGCRLLDFSPGSLKEVFRGMQTVAEVFGCEKKGEHLVVECQKKLKKTSRKYGGKRHTKGVAVIRNWPYLELAGGWLSDLTEMSGAVPVIHGDDTFINPDSYFEQQPSVFIAGRPHVSLRENQKDFAALDRELLTFVFACEAEPSFFAIDGPVFYDHSCTGLDTALKILGEILKDDPAMSERKGVFWDRVSR